MIYETYNNPVSYQGSTAALHFIFSSAAKHDVSDTSLIQEMQQLGLPQDNATVIGAEYSQNKNVLRAKLFEDSYRLSQIMKAECSIDSLQSLEGKESVLQFELLLLIDKKKREPVTSFNTSIDTSIVYEEDLRRLEKSRISLSKNSLELLISELTQAKAIMKSLSKLDNINS